MIRKLKWFFIRRRAICPPPRGTKIGDPIIRPDKMLFEWQTLPPGYYWHNSYY